MHSFTQLVQLFEDRLNTALPFHRQPENLYEPCRYFLALGGKRVRPVLCLMANELFGDISADAWHAAMCIELFHNYTLIHDDMMDNSPLRRGRPTVHEKYGQTAGILSGDIMCVYAYDQLAKVNTLLPKMLQLFNATSIEVCEGQQMDMDFQMRDDVSIEEYTQMITLKTSVLLACSLKMGAMLGGATEGNANKLYEFGKNLGIAFQLQDDYLDAFGDGNKTGKQNGGDIKENKKTYLLLKALENGSDAQREKIAHLLRDNGEDKVPEMMAIFKDTGAGDACRESVTAYSEKAFACLEDAAVISKRKEPLRELAAYLLQRDK